MNERERFEKYRQSVLAGAVEKIQTMTETQVIRRLRALEATRNMTREKLAFLDSVSLANAGDSEEEIQKLRSELNCYPRPSENLFLVSDYIEDALKKRLETLRRKGR